jgi:hypothetical protein
LQPAYGLRFPLREPPNNQSWHRSILFGLSRCNALIKTCA